MASEEAERIGELLLDEGILCQEDLARAIADGGIRGSALAAALEGCRYPRRRELASFLAAGFRVPRLADLGAVDFQAEAVRAVPEEMARKHELVPIAKIGGVLCVAKPNYYNRAAVQDLRRHTGLKIKVLQADEAQVKAAIERIYRGGKGEVPAAKGEAAARPPAPAHPAPAAAAAKKEEAAEIFAAVKVPASEFASEEQATGARLFRDWEDLFLSGRPSQPIKV